MQTLGLSDSTPRSESRLKSLFWPSIQNALDVDYLGVQGYWLCAFVGVFTFLFSTATRHPVAGVLTLLFFYLSGVGIREHSRYAAVVALAFAAADVLASFAMAAPSVFKILFAALLLSNLRATWIASGWKPESEEAVLPPRFTATWTDKFADLLPSWLWPKVRIPYYIFSVAMVCMSVVGMAAMIAQGARQFRGSGASSHAANSAYLAMRSQALQGSRVTFGLPASSDSTQPWGVLMEWETPNGTGTLLVLSDRSASVYFSNGSGYLGSESQAIRQAAESTVNVAGELRAQMHQTTTYPLPQRGEVVFYLLTDGGVYTASGSDEDLKSNRLPLSRLRNTATGLATLIAKENKAHP
jgi:hypothetical protein